jgi:hypothetical protein
VRARVRACVRACVGVQVTRLLNERMSIATLLHSELRLHAAAAAAGLRY